MSLKLLTLNIQGDRHLDRVRDAIALHLPDIVCLQEVFEVDCATLAAVGQYNVKYVVGTYMDAANNARFAPKGSWGLAVLSKLPVQRQVIISYADDPTIRIFRQPNDPRRVVIVTELAHQSRSYRIVTTHFTWSPDGHITDEQRADFVRLKQVMKHYPDYVLCGDFNAPRGREMFAKFTDELSLIDHLPADITTTIDAQYHYASSLELVVDTIFSTLDYHVTDIQLLAGLSDHKGILAMVEKR
jgi:endonuclease/exonuclease/phosphatase family metal-dependent hydrolase